MPKRNGTAAGGFAEQSSDSVLKSSKKYFLPDDSGLYKNFFIGENDECRNLRKSIFCRMAGSKGEDSLMTDEALILQAKDAMKNAYAPYSGFRVGAALLAKDGAVFKGCNVENASYGATNCAERTAVFKAVSEGYREFEKIAIVASSGDYASPCGICRQVLAEFMPEGKVLLYSEEKGVVTYTVRELLPMGFRKEDIR